MSTGCQTWVYTHASLPSYSLLIPQIRDFGYFHPMNHTAWIPLWFVWSLIRGSGQLMGESTQMKQMERDREEEYINWRSWSCLHGDTGDHGMKAKVGGWSLLLTTVCPCFFQVENSNSWFRGVRTCAHLWTSSPMEPGCKLYAVGINLSATRSRSLCLCYQYWLRQQKSSINPLGSIYISFLFRSTTSQSHVLCLSVRWGAQISFLSYPCHHTYFSVLCLPCSPNPSLNILFFSNKFHMVKEYRLQTHFFSCQPVAGSAWVSFHSTH